MLQSSLFSHSKAKQAGTIPNVTISAKESNWAPNGDPTFKALAAKPSKKSKNAPSKTRRDAIKKFPSAI